MGLLETARRIADDVLFPAAPAVDRAARVPVLQLELLASAGLYGAAAAGLRSAAPTSTCRPSGWSWRRWRAASLATAFVWAQHHGLVRALAQPNAPAAMRDDWLPALAAGSVRAGAVYGGLLPGPPRLRATANPAGGWLLSGESPWAPAGGSCTCCTSPRAVRTGPWSGSSWTPRSGPG